MASTAHFSASLVLFTASLVAAHAQDAVTLVHSAKVGEVLVYKVKTDIDIGGHKSTVTSKVTEKTSTVDKNGDYSVESVYSDVEVTSLGGSPTEMTQPSDTISFKADGELSKLVGPKIDGPAVRLAEMLVFKLPTAPVKIGDTWPGDIAADPKTQAAPAKVAYKVTGREKLGTFDCLVVSVKYQESAGDKPASCDQTVWIDVATATLVKRQAVIKNVPAAYTNLKENITATITVLRDQLPPAPPSTHTGG
jgi:hypothetical protein